MRGGSSRFRQTPSTGPLRGRTLRVGPKKFAEPVSLPSTDSADLPLPGTAFGTGFVLLALRARRKQHTNALAVMVKGGQKVKLRNLRIFLFPTVHRRIVQCDKAPKRRSPAPGRDHKNSPSRFRFRPPLPLTFPLRVLPSDSVSTYLRSVLGAISTLTSGSRRSRGREKTWPQFAEISVFNISTANLATCGYARGKEKPGRSDRKKTPHS